MSNILLQYLSYWIAIGFGTGWFYYAPGTFATVFVGFPLYWVLQTVLNHFYTFFLLFATLFGILCCHIAENMLKKRDHQSIVWDEVCGYLCTMLSIPFQTHWMIIGFFLFRFFDIVKPNIIGYVNRHFKGGVGIMLDDVIAGLFANFIMRLILFAGLGYRINNVHMPQFFV